MFVPAIYIYACANGIGYRNPGAVQVARSSRTMSATTELKFRARLQHPQAPMDDSRGVLPDPGESALKARDLGNAFENPDAPREYTDAEMSGMTLMSNSPDAFKGREIRVTHAQPCRFDDRTTNKDHFPGHQPDSRCASRPHPRIIQPSSRFGDVRGCYPVPALKDGPTDPILLVRRPRAPISPQIVPSLRCIPFAPLRPIHVPKAYAPSPAKFSSNTTNKDTFVAHTIPPQQPFEPKPYRHAPAKFDDRTTNKDHFPGHQPELMTYGPKKAYAPSPAKFSSNTTNKDTFVAHPIPPQQPFEPKPYRHAPAKFDDRTTNKDHFPGHQPELMTYGPKKAYAPSPAKFSSNTTNKDTHVGFEPPAKLPPIGLWVENNRTEVLIHGGSDLPARASRMFSTTKHGQDSVALRIVQGWSRAASDNKLLGVFEMKGISPGPPGRTQIRVTLNVDAAGELVVEGVNVDTGQVQMARAKAAVR